MYVLNGKAGTLACRPAALWSFTLIEPMATSVLTQFSDDLTAYLKRAKAASHW